MLKNKEKAKTIIFDADGTLFDTESFEAKRGYDFLKEIYDVSIIDKIYDAGGYNFKEMYSTTSSEEKQFWNKNILPYTYKFKARRGMSDIIKKLKSEGYYIVIATAKAFAQDKYKGKIVKFLFEEQLKENNIEVDEIRYIPLENAIQGKIDVCNEFNAYAFVEDNKLIVEELENVFDTKVICMRTRNNSNYYSEKVNFVNNPFDIYTLIKKEEDKENKKSSIFSVFEDKSQSLREKMSTTELKEYYINFQNYLKSLPYDEKRIQDSKEYYKKIFNSFGRAFNLIYKPEVIGKEELPNEDGIIFVSNHLCNKDTLLILSALEDRAWHPLAKEELLYSKTGKIFSGINSVFVQRKNEQSRKNSTLSMGIDLINDLNITIFIESTYKEKFVKSNLRPYELCGKSPAYLSQALNKPIVLVALDYQTNKQPIIRFSYFSIVKTEEDLEIVSRTIYENLENLIEENKKLKISKTKTR